MPFPGPPALNDPPPPSNIVSTVIAVEALVSRQPPLNSNPSTMDVIGESLFCLKSPPTYVVGVAGDPSPLGSVANIGSAIRTSSSCSHPLAASTTRGAVKFSRTNSLRASPVM